MPNPYANLGRAGAIGVPARMVDAECECPPACPSCGGLECLCRPRFFPGQVLTDDDLNRLENYVIAKNKLHNRYFQGSGVVCGLEVVCDACNPTNVAVKTGYALSPCGEDIIVCKDASVNICDLINRCKPRDECDPYSAQQPTNCKEGVQQWILSICYDEKPSRGVQPLMSEPCSCSSKGGCGCSGSGSSCGCGGSCGGTASSGGCSCSSKPASTAKAKGKNTAKYNPQCEPTLICESFRFTATRWVDPTKRTRSDYAKYGMWGVVAANSDRFGPLLTQLLLCYSKAAEIRDAYQNQQFNNAAANDQNAGMVYVEYLNALREFAAEHVAHRCDLARQLSCPDVPTYTRGDVFNRAAGLTVNWADRFVRLNEIWLELFRECFCSALLPPCQDARASDCVPLAVVTIDVDTCKVIEICNWSAREFALTLPNLYYWTSFLNWGAIKDAIAKLCCDPAYSRIWITLMHALEQMMSNSAQKTNAIGQPMIAHAAAQPGATTPDSSALSGTAAATMQAMMGMLEQVTMPDGMARLLSIVQPPQARASKEVADLHRTVSELQKTVAEQGEVIKRLMR